MSDIQRHRPEILTGPRNPTRKRSSKTRTCRTATPSGHSEKKLILGPSAAPRQQRVGRVSQPRDLRAHVLQVLVGRQANPLARNALQPRAALPTHSMRNDSVRALCLADPIFSQRYDGWTVLGTGTYATVAGCKVPRCRAGRRAQDLPWALAIGSRRVREEGPCGPEPRLRRTVQVYSVFDRGPLTWFEMELVDGPNLDQALAALAKEHRRASMPLRALDIALAVSRCLGTHTGAASSIETSSRRTCLFPSGPRRRPSSPTSGSLAWVIGRGYADGQHHRYLGSHRRKRSQARLSTAPTTSLAFARRSTRLRRWTTAISNRERCWTGTSSRCDPARAARPVAHPLRIAAPSTGRRPH